MATIITTGVSKWAKVLPEQLEVGKYNKEKGGEWSIDLYVTEDEQDVLVQKGIMPSKFKQDKNGETFLKVKRPKLRKKGEVEQEPPRVIDRAGETFEEEIGNGSTVRIAFDVFGQGSMQGFNLNDVQVIEWVEFNRDGVIDNRGALDAYEDDTE